jgi:hypothetical protein
MSFDRFSSIYDLTSVKAGSFNHFISSSILIISSGVNELSCNSTILSIADCHSGEFIIDINLLL